MGKGFVYPDLCFQCGLNKEIPYHDFIQMHEKLIVV